MLLNLKKKTEEKKKKIKKDPRADLPHVGWRESVDLPDLRLKKIRVKVDTGARTSALHATNISFFSARGKKRVKFRVCPNQDTSRGQRWATAPLEGIREVKSSIGISTKRPTITTDLVIGEHRFPIKLTLINRDVMGFRMLLGREALRNRFVVDTGKSFLMKKKKKKKKVKKIHKVKDE